jgi:hypothetical protein
MKTLAFCLLLGSLGAAFAMDRVAAQTTPATGAQLVTLGTAGGPLPPPTHPLAPIQNGPRRLRPIKGLQWQTLLRGDIGRQRLFRPLANPGEVEASYARCGVYSVNRGCPRTSLCPSGTGR